MLKIKYWFRIIKLYSCFDAIAIEDLFGFKLGQQM